MDTLDEYLAFARSHPDMFANPPGAIFTILLDPDDIHRVEREMGERLESKGMPAEWARVGIAYRDQYMTLLRDAVRFPDGSLGTYIRFVDWGGGTPGVIVLALYQGQVILERHFRHATRSWHLEVPRGFGEPGLSPEANARRELEEELGAVVSRLELIGTVYPDAGASTEHDALFYAEIQSYAAPEEHEAIAELTLVPIQEFERMMRDDEITDGFTLMAYAHAKLHGFL